MTVAGGIFMLLSVGTVWTLTIWCFKRVLTLPAEKDNGGDG